MGLKQLLFNKGRKLIRVQRTLSPLYITAAEIQYISILVSTPTHSYMCCHALHQNSSHPIPQLHHKEGPIEVQVATIIYRHACCNLANTSTEKNQKPWFSDTLALKTGIKLIRRMYASIYVPKQKGTVHKEVCNKLLQNLQHVLLDN